MKLLVKYIDFHWDNHQGGSGKSFELSATIDIPDEEQVKHTKAYVEKWLHDKTQSERPFNQNNKFSVVSVKIISF